MTLRSGGTCADGGAVWEVICNALGVTFPIHSKWPDDKPWYDLSLYRFTRHDFALCVAFAIAITILRYRVQSISRKMAIHFGINDSDVQFKFSESVWKMLFYMSSFSWGLLLVVRRDWSWAVSYDACFDHVPALYSSPDDIAADIYLFYIFQVGFYLHSIYAHLFVEIRRKDFAEMLVHHVATLLLIAISFSTRFTAVGTLIVVVHDFSDILLEIAKTYIYRSRDNLANVWFTLWVLSWIALRLVYFPFYILPASVYVSVAKIGYYPHYITCALMLITLQILHVVWSFMIARMIYRMFAGTADKIRDTREDDENTDDESSADGAAAKAAKPAAKHHGGKPQKRD